MRVNGFLKKLYSIESTTKTMIAIGLLDFIATSLTATLHKKSM